jgi:threonine dehydrogenase-like Zn-dependent dehydrogenase
MGRMTAVIGDGRGARVTEVAAPRRPPGWVAIDVLLAGICRTDVYAAEGRLPIPRPTVLGHELVGDVVEADEADALARGDRVTVDPRIPCGACRSCTRGAACAEPRMLGVDVDGAFAERLVVPARCAHRVPGDLPLRRAASVEPIAAALAVTRAPIRRDMRGAVAGDGRIAELTRRVLRARGFESIDSRDDAPLDFVVEASGTEAGLAGAVERVAPGGLVVLKSRPPRPVPFDVARAVKRDVTLACVSYGAFGEAVSLAGALALDDLLGDLFPLGRFDAAMARAREEPLGPKPFLSPTKEPPPCAA